MPIKPLASGFHAHTHFSLDGASPVKSLVSRSKELGRPAIVVTDHGNMNALADLHMECKKQKLKAIHGIELYVRNDEWLEPYVDKEGKTKFQIAHLTVHFLDNIAYEWFCKKSIEMEQRALVVWGERKPILLWEELLEIGDHITMGSGCLGSFVMKLAAKGQFDKAERVYCILRNTVKKGRFFAEIFPHKLTEEWKRPELDRDGNITKPGYYQPYTDPECGHAPLDVQKKPNMFVLEMARKYGDPIVFSEDSHLACPEDWPVQNIKMGRGSDSWRFSIPYAMRESDYWAQCLKEQIPTLETKDFEEFVDNSYYFVSLFDNYKFHTSDDRWVLPKTEIIFGDRYKEKTNKEILRELIISKGRFPKKNHPQFKEYQERLAYEVSVLCDNGQIDLLPYFFLLADVVDWARDHGRICNARGSAGGCLVAYLLGITITDPIKWGLQFERFLTLGRIKAGTLPDIDLDFDVKDVVYEYLRNKYDGKIAKISINTLIKLKSAIRDVERVELGTVRDETEFMCRKIPNPPQGVDCSKWLFGYEDPDTGAWTRGFFEENTPISEELREYAKNNENLWNQVMRCLGIVRQKSVHACGVLLADDEITKYVPLTTVSEELVTAYCPKGCEYSGLVKFDLLGVKTLEACRITLDSIKEHTGEKIEWKEFDHDDLVYEEIIGKRKLASIFQISTRTMLPFVLAMNPKSTEDLCHLVALVRPGTLDAPVKVIEGGELPAAEVFMDCYNGKRNPYFIHPDLIPILGSTYGINLYQEQTLRLFRDLGNFTYEEAEVARRAIGKKIKEILAQEIRKLEERLRTKGTWSEDQIKELSEMIIASCNYSFNRSHSAAYGCVSYNGMYFKFHFPLHFYRGALSINTDDHDELRVIMKECSNLVLPPKVGKSSSCEWIIEDGKFIRAPLSLIKGVGPAVSESLNRFISEGIDHLEMKEKKEPKARKKKKDENTDVGTIYSYS